MYKPIKFFLFVLAFMGLFLTSCQKEEVQTKTGITQAEVQKIVKEQKIKDMKHIHHFLDKMTAVLANTSVSGREKPLTLNEMTFGTEAVLNMYFTNPSNRFLEKDVSVSEVTVPVVDGSVNDADLLSAYTEIAQKMTDHLGGASYANKDVVYVDVVIQNTTATEATLEVRTAVGDRRLDPPPAPPYFTKGWRCGYPVTNDNDSLQVGDLNYDEPDKDAAKLFTSTLNDHFRLDNALPENPGSCLYSYGVTAATASLALWEQAIPGFPELNPNDPTENDNSKDFKFFKIRKSANSNYESKKYLNLEEMIYYYSGLEETILKIEDPIWQSNHPTIFPEHVPLDSESWFVGWTFLSVDGILPLEIRKDQSDAETVHIPEITLQQTIGTMCIPINTGDPIDAIDGLSDLDWP